MTEKIAYLPAGLMARRLAENQKTHGLAEASALLAASRCKIDITRAIIRPKGG